MLVFAYGWAYYSAMDSNLESWLDKNVPEGETFTIPMFGSILNLDIRTVYKIIRSGNGPPILHLPSGGRLILRNDLLDWIRQNRRVIERQDAK
jgi:hypothetical protein